MRKIIAFTAVIALAGCAGAPKVVPRAAPRPVPAYVPPPPAPLPSDWRDWPYTPGDWQYETNQFSTQAVFTGGFTISCDNDHRVRLSRIVDPTRGAGAMTIRTSSAQRTLPVTSIGHPPVGVVAVLMPNDTLLEAMAFSRGRFVVEQPGLPTLVLPSWAEIGRVTEDCRR